MQLSKINVRGFVNKLRGIPIELNLGKYRKILMKINEYELEAVNDATLNGMSADLIRRVRQGIPHDDLIIEAFALVRETSRRVTGMRHFDVQILAGIAMQKGKLVEMQTGEGKTLAAVLPAYLSALTGRGVHILTFNDYLARRDAAWMGPIFEFLGLTVGRIQQGMNKSGRRKAYAADITYATAREAGFDYLRDHLCYDKGELVHRPFHLAIVDEADSILVDEARVPLVIAGVTGAQQTNPFQMAEIAQGLVEGVDFETDDEKRNVYLTDRGLERVEAILGCGSLHDSKNLHLLTDLNLALHAGVLLRRDIDYIVRSGRVEIVDEFTGRVVENRHWPDGLQAAVEAKERLQLKSGGEILGSITLQHFLRLYPKLSGMTATAQSAANELAEFYGLKVVVIPPNRPCVRVDQPDAVFTHKRAKTDALIEEIKRVHATGRPVLVGTSSVEESEHLAALLLQSGVACHVLNAKNDELEAEIIARAGAPGAVTISTNMAGRGTDIKLGGEREQEREKVTAMGGLYVIGTNRHESLRIDIQLRGRAGRQGDHGESRFFISLEDDLIEKNGLMELFPKGIRNRKLEGLLDNPWVTREVARGQRIVEGQNFEIRKTLWRYSSLVENQRKLVMKRRQEVLRDKYTLNLLETEAPELYSKLHFLLRGKRLREIEKRITLLNIDRFWAGHLALIADVRESIHLVSIGGQSPLSEFNKIVTDAFLGMEKKIGEGIIAASRSLTVSDNDIDLDREDLKGPSSTWTYLVSDNQFGDWMEMLKGKNIGYAAGAALYVGPLLIAWGILQRFFKRSR